MSPEPRKGQEPQQKTMVASSGEPFKTDSAASSARAAKGLSPHAWEVLPLVAGKPKSGFVLSRVKPGIAAEIIPPAPKEKFYRVKFQSKSQPNDQTDVTLSVNGDPLTIQREKVVIIAERYKECAEHATYPTFRQVPNEARKETGNVRIFPFDVLGAATEAEFRAQCQKAPVEAASSNG